MNNPNLYQLSEFVVKKIIIKEEIINKLYVNGKPITNLTPDWARIRSSIESKYKKLVGVDEMILNEQFFYYLETKNWNKHINCFVERVEKYGMRWLGIAPTNVIASSFKHCHDSALLSKAINWANPVILKSISDFAWRELIEKSGSGIGLPWNNDFTNYAVLLYNLGKKQEAIKWVELHIKALNVAASQLENASFKSRVLQNAEKKQKVLAIMKNGELIDELPSDWFY
jgi:hypothetical protein